MDDATERVGEEQVKDVAVSLDGKQMKRACLVGAKRQIQCLEEGRRDSYGFNGNKGLELHVEGAAGELAVSVALGLPWDESVGTFKSGPDVGESVQVRTRSRHDYELLVRPDDPEDSIFVLVTGISPELTVRGWMIGKDCKNSKWLETHGGRPPAYFVPTSELLEFSI